MKIGIFDSGYGGLTIYKAIHQQLPDYDYIYFGDNARAPYGDLSLETITDYTWEAVQRLFAADCALIILACNTASANALRNIQQKYLPLSFPDRRVLGVIRPSIETLGELPAGANVAIWGTTATINSDSYAIEAAKYAPEINLFQLACPLLVPLIEHGSLSGGEITQTVQQYWQSTLNSMPEVETLLLACTHYPLIQNVISSTHNGVKIISQGKIVAAKLQSYLHRHPEIESRLTKSKSEEFTTTGDHEKFAVMREFFLR